MTRTTKRPARTLTPADLKHAAVSPRFRQNYKSATEAGFTVHLLKQRKKREPFVACAFTTYVRDLAQLAEVDLRPVLERFALQGRAASSTGFGKAAATLAREIGLSEKETAVQVLTELAEEYGFATTSLDRAARGDVIEINHDEATLAGPALTEFRNTLTGQRARTWDRLRADVSAAYKDLHV